MNRLFWGLFFILLDWDLALGSAVFELLPDFIGFFLIMKGMQRLSGESRYFSRGQHLAFGLFLASLIFYGADLLDPDSMTRVWLWGFQLIALAAELVLLRMIVRGICDTGANGEHLRMMWIILSVLMPLAHLVGWVPLVGTVSKCVVLLMAALFLGVFQNCCRRVKE